MSKEVNPYKNLKAETPGGREHLEELSRLWEIDHDQRRMIKDTNHLDIKRDILGDAIRNKFIDGEQYDKISVILKRSPERIDMTKEIQKYNKDYKGPQETTKSTTQTTTPKEKPKKIDTKTTDAQIKKAKKLYADAILEQVDLDSALLKEVKDMINKKFSIEQLSICKGASY